MASGKGVSSGGFDERLAAVRDSALFEGENVVAQEEGDQGQALILTDFRVLVIKVGITATATSHGQILGAFPLGDLSAINVRKGPLGAVIQVCTERKELLAESGPPNNVVVFTGPQRMKKCEAIAALIEGSLGKPCGRIPPKGAPRSVESTKLVQPESVASESVEAAEQGPGELVIEAQADAQASAKTEAESSKRRGGREERSLAEEMFAEMMGGAPDPTPPARPEPGVKKPAKPAADARPSAPEAAAASEPQAPPASQSVPASIIESINDVAEPAIRTEQFEPNPFLPKPIRNRNRAAGKVLVLFGSLAALMLVGMAVTAPLRAPDEAPVVNTNITVVTDNPQVARRHRMVVADYQAKVAAIASQSKRTMSAVSSAVHSGTKGAGSAGLQSDALDKAWQKVSAIPAPPGLAGAKESLTSGLFIGKTAVANLSGGLQTATPPSANETLARISEATMLINKGLASISKMRSDLEKQSSRKKLAAKPAK